MTTEHHWARTLDDKTGWRIYPLPGEDLARGAFVLDYQGGERDVHAGALVRVLQVTSTRWVRVQDDNGGLALLPESAVELVNLG